MGLSPETRQWRIDNKICVRCGEEPALSGNQRGAVCDAKFKASREKGKDAKIEQGICIDCDRPATNGQRCAYHAAYQDEKRAARREKRTAHKLCPECGKPVTGDNKLCDADIAKRSVNSLERYHAKASEGILCAWSGCTNPPREDSVYCQNHLTWQSENRKSSYRECKKQGWCYFCPIPKNPVLPGKSCCASCKSKVRTIQQRVNLRRKCKVLDHYGWQCTCCHCGIPEMLEIDHIVGGGTKHRREIGRSQLYKWLVKNNFPDGYQTLCAGCNKAKRDTFQCLHQRLPPQLLRDLQRLNAELTHAWKLLHPESFVPPPRQKSGRQRKETP